MHKWSGCTSSVGWVNFPVLEVIFYYFYINGGNLREGFDALTANQPPRVGDSREMFQTTVPAARRVSLDAASG